MGEDDTVAVGERHVGRDAGHPGRGADVGTPSCSSQQPRRDTRAGVVAGITGAFSNCVLVGIPLITGVYGDEGIAILSKILTILQTILYLRFVILMLKEFVKRGDILTF